MGPRRELTCFCIEVRKASLDDHMVSLSGHGDAQVMLCVHQVLGLRHWWVKRQRLQQAWVCLSCLSELEANILNGFKYSEVSFFWHNGFSGVD